MFSLNRSKIRRPGIFPLFLLLVFFCFCPWVRADWSSELTIAPGVKHIFMRKESGPWEINLLKANLEEADVSLETVLANNVVMGNAPLSAMANAVVEEGRYPLATINGDFFRRSPDPFAGDPFGLQVIRGEMVSFPDRTRSSLLITADGKPLIAQTSVSAWAISSGGVKQQINGLNQPRGIQELVLYTPRFGATTGSNSFGYEVYLSTGDAVVPPNGEIKAQVTAVQPTGNSFIPRQGMILSGHGEAAEFLKKLNVGEEIKLVFELNPAIRDIQEAIGGGPRIIRDGRVAIDTREEGFAGSLASGRNPRSAVGLSPESILFVTVDGRSSRSAGMTLPELANFLLSLGCVEGLNLDGGGSTEMMIRGHVANRPSDGQERSLANALVLMTRAPAQDLIALTLEPSLPGLLAGGSMRLALKGWDVSANQFVVRPQEARWKITPEVGSIGADGNFQVNENIKRAANVTIEASFADLTARAKIAVFPLPATLRVLPKRTLLGQNERQQFIIEGNGPDKSPIPSILLKPAWSCSPEIGTIDSRGNLQTGSSPGTGFVTARIGEAVGQAEVSVVPRNSSSKE
jgi:exopolysaccharide biosynthesis protein